MDVVVIPLRRSSSDDEDEDVAEATALRKPCTKCGGRNTQAAVAKMRGAAIIINASHTVCDMNLMFFGEGL
jgi:hypothetical protein